MISWMEVMCGAGNEDERQAAKALFASMKAVEISMEVAMKAVGYRRTQRLKLPDAIILACADCQGCILVTRNTKDFDVGNPMVRIPYRV
ncbi:PIN domain-containing protein [Phragmitibacter flavus]|uniref:PIN domain-containing protein n=1 Tax=Phragmitibacter flavus TaxID=2576071 RepID=UPI00197EF2DC